MSKILLTGMSAPQASMSANNKTLSFAGLIYKTLTAGGHDVTWADPDVSTTKAALNKYDAVLVGISPVTSLAANRIYGALSVIDHLWGSSKLSLFIDAPQVNQIEFSLKAVLTKPESFTKEFFSYRKDYSKVVSDQKTLDRLMRVISKLYESEWPTLVYPKLPWSNESAIKKLLPSGVSNLSGINLDAYLFEDRPVFEERRSKWAIDNYKNDWISSTVKTLTLPHSPMKWNKGWTDTDVIAQIDRSIAALVAPHKREGSWWTPRIAQALSSRTPVITDWKQAGVLGAAWSLLASSIEEMSVDKRNLLALAQSESYQHNIPTKSSAITMLETIIKVSNNKEKTNE